MKIEPCIVIPSLLLVIRISIDGVFHNIINTSDDYSHRHNDNNMLLCKIKLKK